MKCNKCLKLLDPSKFYKNSKKASGLQGECKSCQNERKRRYRDGERLRESGLAKSRSPTTPDEFWAKVDRTQEHWLWKGNPARGERHVQTTRHGRMILVHRLAWEFTFGPIPIGLNVCHHCDIPRCINPIHLFLGTTSDNNADMALKHRHGQSKKTQCPAGHDYDQINTIVVRSTGERRCRTCVNARKRHQRQRARGTKQAATADQ